MYFDWVIGLWVRVVVSFGAKTSFEEREEADLVSQSSPQNGKKRPKAKEVLHFQMARTSRKSIPLEELTINTDSSIYRFYPSYHLGLN